MALMGGSAGGSGGGGGGTVTSVGLTVPASSIFSVTGSPVTTSGTIDIGTTGTSGGIPYFSSSSQLSSSAVLTANRLMLGGGAGTAPTVLGSLGTTTTVLHGNASGAPTFGAVSLTADVSGILPVANGGNGLNGGSTTLTTAGNITAMPIATSLIRYNNGSATNIQGITAGTDGQIITIESVGTQLVIVHESGSATAANRISLTNGQDLTLPGGSTGANVALRYDGVSQRWKLFTTRSPISTNSTATSANIYSNVSGTPGGALNVVLGTEAISAGTYTGSSGVILGYRAGRNINGAPNNLIAIGANSASVVTGVNNIVVGTNSATTLSTGTSNTIIGGGSATSLTTGDSNVILGPSSALQLTSGVGNLVLGAGSGVGITTGTSIIAIGGGSGISSGGLTNCIAIGNSARCQGSNQMSLGGIIQPVNVGINNNNPQYRLDVGGDINVTGNYRINGSVFSPNVFWRTDGNTSTGGEFLGFLDQAPIVFKTFNAEVAKFNEFGLFGVSQTTPEAVIHAGNKNGTIVADVSLNSSITVSAGGGYSFGSGNKDYSVYSSVLVSGVRIFANTAPTTSFSEPSSSDFDPSGGSATEIGGTGYDTAFDPPPSYQIWALYDSGSVFSINTAFASIGSWSGSNPFADVNVSWTPPTNTSGLVGYFIGRNGSDGQTVLSNSFTDNNTGWGGGSSPSGSVLAGYNVFLTSFGSAGADLYRFLNTTSGTFFDSTTPSTTDNNSWSAGSTVTPTSAPYDSFVADGIAKFGDQLQLTTEGKGIKIKEGSNAKMGTATLSSGAVTVSTTAVTTTSRIFVTAVGSSTLHGALWVDNIVDATSFDIASTSVTDDSVVNWIIFDPS